MSGRLASGKNSIRRVGLPSALRGIDSPANEMQEVIRFMEAAFNDPLLLAFRGVEDRPTTIAGW
jgi:hypothetical protein